MKKDIQAKHIDDSRIVQAVSDAHPHSHRQAIIALFPDVPSKIVTAKLRQATLKKLLIGCASDSCARRGANGCYEVYRVAEVLK